MKKYFNHSYRKYLTLGVFSFASLIGTLYVMAAGGPIGYTYCADEGSNCTLNSSTEVAYGANGYFLYQTVGIGTSSIRCTSSTFGADPISGVVKSCYKKVSIASVIANLPWLNSRGVAITESQNDGFAVSQGTSKDMNVHGECKKVTAPAGKNVFVPTRDNTLEWKAFKDNASENIGVILGNCAGGPPSCNNNGVRDNGESGIDCGGGNCGACGVTPACNVNSPGLCSPGSVFNDNGLTAPGTTRRWMCSGGTTTVVCSYTYPGSTRVDGVCDNNTYGGCTAGNISWIDSTSSCGTTAKWTCKGINSGSDSSPTCSRANSCSTPPTSVVTPDPSPACVQVSGSYYKIQYYTQTNPQMSPPLQQDEQKSIGIYGIASFQGYVGGNARWAQVVNPVIAYTTASCTPVGPPSPNACASVPYPEAFPNVDTVSINRTPPAVNGQAWSYSTSGGSCTYKCLNGYSETGCAKAPVVGVCQSDTIKGYAGCISAGGSTTQCTDPSNPANTCYCKSNVAITTDLGNIVTCPIVSCGGADGQSLGVAPSGQNMLCGVGIPIAQSVSGNGPWSWKCGMNGTSGTAINCGASKASNPVGDCDIQWYPLPSGPTNDVTILPGQTRNFAGRGFTYIGSSLSRSGDNFTCPAPSYTYAWDSWSAWSECAGTSCPGTQSRTASTCRRSPDNVVVADSFCGNNTETQSCIGHSKDTAPACALPPSNKFVCVYDTAVCGNSGWSSLGDGSCKNRNEDQCAFSGP